MKFPILVFDRGIDLIVLDYKFLMGDVRLINQSFRNVEVVDSLGNLYKIKNVIKDSGINLIESIKKVGLMVRLKPVLEEGVTHISLIELQNKIVNYVSANPKKWEHLDNIQNLKETIYFAKNYEELIRIFN
ncbi:hypothetical protein NAL32_20970 [Chryseobacterium sp. Ch-15]|uniref:Uncharacterized protein n=1 Tax=Chryseobacterium muglaense TaxID=2893752 RepID=A0A9Q3UYU5_9FLAO|nr:hypothetical protein [Chryseobacterium muglaense]MBD3906402.1 hypothetical protein [Chryseobacterium muglaense]MCC9037097.1 hypothetical protein [Chryseobacterium muglaense]MCM2556864.1 hypothetical protein [Chryseobacterium muglaense]